MKRLRIPERLRELGHAIIENKGLKLLSIVLAVLLFILSRQPIAHVRFNGVPVEFRGVPAGMEIVNTDSPLVSVQLQGPRNLVMSLTSNQISVIANVTNKEPGERIAHLQSNDVTRPDHVEVLQISPPSIRLRLERTASRLVKVVPRTDEELPPGLEIYDIRILPPTIEIEGPANEVGKTLSLETETVNLAGKTTSFEAIADVETPPYLRVKTREQIKLMIEVGERRESRTISGVPLYFKTAGGRNLAGGRRPVQRTLTIEIFGPRSIVQSLTAAEISGVINEDPVTHTSAPLPEIILPESARGLVVVRSISPTTIKLN
jgi:hypothetical protein